LPHDSRPIALKHEENASMVLSRRSVLAGAACLVAVRPAAADDERALFWRIGSGTDNSSILFGYERIGANIAPGVVSDGDRLVESVHAVIADMNPNIRFPPVSLDRQATKPIVQLLSPNVGDQLRTALAATPAKAAVDTMTGFEATFILMSEGQHPPTPSVGGTIAEHAASHGRPLRQLLSNDDVAAAYQAPDMTEVNAKIGEAQIAYLLQLRQRVGAIGGHFEQLYAARQSAAIERVTADIDAHGIPNLSELLLNARLRQLMVDRAAQFATNQPSAAALLLLPLGVLTGVNGVLAALKASGATITAVA
jgi:hypothetical protein